VKCDADHWKDNAEFAVAYHTLTVSKLQERIKKQKAKYLDEDEKYFEEKDKPKEKNFGRLGYGSTY
jgi:hypothetical protein